MPKLVNRAKMTTATTGTGTITLGSAVDGYQTFANAGVANSNIVRYAIEDGNAWEIGTGTYTAAGTTLSRTPSESSSGGAAINLSGGAVVYVTVAASDLQELVNFAETFTLPTADGTNGQVLTTDGSGTLSFQPGGGGGSSPEIGDVVYAETAPTTGTWLEAGKYYSKSSYPALAAALGDVPDFGNIPAVPQAVMPVAFNTLTTPANLAPYYTATNGTVTVVVGQIGSIRVTTDGLIWRAVLSPSASTYRSIQYLNGNFVALTTVGEAIYSADGYTWARVAISAETGNANSVAYGAGVYVIVGANGRVNYSSDLQTWASTTAPTSNAQLNCVTFASGLFVAVGDSGRCVTSPDGITWTLRTLPGGGVYNEVIHDGTKFIVAGTDISTSPDGITWTLALAQSARNIVYANGLYVAGAGNSLVHVSTDGFAYSSYSLTNFGAITKIVWNGTLFYAFGPNGRYATSPDGSTWTIALDPSLVSFNTGAVVNGKVVAFGTSVSVVLAGAARKIIFGTSSGWGYAPQNSTTNRNPRRVAYDGVGQYAIVSGSGAVLTSSNGQAWSAAWVGMDDALDVVQYVNGRYFTGGAANGAIFTSTDGVTWTNVGVVQSAAFTAFAFGAGVYVASAGATGGTAGYLFSSTDGITWTQNHFDSAVALYDVIFANGIFVAVGGTGTGSSGTTACYTSTDGTTWTLRTTVATTGWRRVIYENSLFVIVGNGGRIATSPDGITWTGRTSNVTQNLFSIAWSGSLFCAVGNAGNITTSPDGVTWTSRTTSVTNTLFSVAWGNGRFITAGDAVSLVSTDGITWSRASTAIRGPQDFMSYVGGQFISVGITAVQVSSDGVTWRTSNEVIYVPTGVLRMFKQAGVYHALTTSSGLFYSTDGTEFLPVRNIPNTAAPRSIAYDGTRWMVTVPATSPYPQSFYTSTDGINWTRASDWGTLTNTTTVSGQNYALVYASGNFVTINAVTTAQGIFSPVYTSSDNGVTWTPRWPPLAPTPAGWAASDGTTIIAPFTNPTSAMISTNGGVTWSIFSGGESGNPVIYTNGVWVIGTNSYTTDLTAPSMLRLGLNSSVDRGVYVHDGRIIYTVTSAGSTVTTLQTVGTGGTLFLRNRSGTVPFTMTSNQNAPTVLRGSTALFGGDTFSNTGNVCLIGEIDLYGYNTTTTFWVPPGITGGIQGQKAFVYAGA